jgi:pentatricopeptide repeat protein
MHAQGLTGPAQMYNSVIAACGIRWKPALEAFLGMQCAGVEVTAQSATLLMASLCAAKQRDHAIALLQQVSQARWILSLTAYSSLLKLLASIGDWRAADMCHSHMMCSGLRPDAAAAAAIVNAHAIGGDAIGSEQLTQHFISTGILPVASGQHRYPYQSSLSQGSQGSTPKSSGKASPIRTVVDAEDAVAEVAAAAFGAGSDGCQSMPISESLESEPIS